LIFDLPLPQDSRQVDNSHVNWARTDQATRLRSAIRGGFLRRGVGLICALGVLAVALYLADLGLTVIACAIVLIQAYSAIRFWVPAAKAQRMLQAGTPQ